MPTKLTSTALVFTSSGQSGSLGFSNDKITATQAKFLAGVKTSFLNIGEDLNPPDFGELASGSFQLKSGEHTFALNTQATFPQTAVLASPEQNRNLNNNVSVVDGGIVVAVGDRILLRKQSNKVDNGVYEKYPDGKLYRASDFAVGGNVSLYTIFVSQGTSANKTFVCTNAAGEDVVGTDALNFVEYVPYTLTLPPFENNNYLSYDKPSGAWTWTTPPSLPLGSEKVWNFANNVFAWSSAYTTKSGLTFSSTNASFTPSFVLNSDKGTRLVVQSTSAAVNQSVVSWSQPSSSYWEIRAAVHFGPLAPVSEGFIFFGNDSLASLDSSDSILGAGHLTGYGVEIDFNGYDSDRFQIVVHEGETKTPYWCGISFSSLFRVVKVARNGQVLRFEISEQGTIAGTAKVVVEHALTENYTGTRYGFTSYTSGTSAARHNAELTYFESRVVAENNDDM